MEKLGSDNHWKPQTLLTVLARLTEKGFLDSVRKGRERQYTALISEDEYLEVEASDFLKRHSGRSMGGFVKTLFSSNSFSEMNWMSCVVCSTKESRMEGISMKQFLLSFSSDQFVDIHFGAFA